MNFLNDRPKLRKSIYRLLSIGTTNCGSVGKCSEMEFMFQLAFKRRDFTWMGIEGKKEFIPPSLFNLPDELIAESLRDATNGYIMDRLNEYDVYTYITDEDLYNLISHTGLLFIPIEVIKKHLKKQR